MVPREDVPHFVAQVLADAGLDIPLPVLVFDVPPDSGIAGYHHSPTGEIHLRDEPKIDAELVLHEVAHHIVGSRPSHGVVFRSCLAMLVETVWPAGTGPVLRLPTGAWTRRVHVAPVCLLRAVSIAGLRLAGCTPEGPAAP